MKTLSPLKTFIYTISVFLFISLGIFTSHQISNAQVDNSLSARLSGRILLQVEANGEAWYLNPDNNLRYFLGRPHDAFNIMRELGLGISEDNYNNFSENGTPSKYSGKILLRVENNGEAYYINPETLEMHYLGRPADAFNIMRTLGLGITNDNLEKINKYENNNNNQEENSSSETKEESNNENNTELEVITNKPGLMTNFTHIISLSASISKIDNIAEKGILYKYTSIEGEELTPTLDDYEKKLVDSSNNNNTINVDITNLIPQTYPHIRAYVIDSNNNIHYGNIETIDSVGRSGLLSIPVSGVTKVIQDEVQDDGLDLKYSSNGNGFIRIQPEWTNEEEFAFMLASSKYSLVDDRFYMFVPEQNTATEGDEGGDVSFIATSTIYTYDGDSFSILDKELSTSTMFASVEVIGDKVYFIYQNGDYIGGDVYDINSNEISPIPNNGTSSVAVGTYKVLTESYDNKIYVVLATEEGYGFQVFDPQLGESGTWSDVIAIVSEPPPEALVIGDVIIYDSKFVFIGLFGEAIGIIAYDLNEDEYVTSNELAPSIPMHIDFDMPIPWNIVNYKGNIILFDLMSMLVPESQEYYSSSVYLYDFDSYSYIKLFENENSLIMSSYAVKNDLIYKFGGANVYREGDANPFVSNYSINMSFLDDNYIEGIFEDNFTINQKIEPGEDSYSVWAYPNDEYEFYSWSDENTDNPRKDINVQDSLDVTANFQSFKY